MNGVECGKCGNIQCTCEETERMKILEFFFEHKFETVIKNNRLIEEFDQHTEELYNALMKPKGIRHRLLRFLYPEIRNVADSLRKCYWHNL